MKTPSRRRYKWYQLQFKGMMSRDVDIVNSSYDAVLFRRREAVPYLCTKFLNSLTQSTADIMMRYFCVQLLCFSQTKEAMHILLLALNDLDPRVRREAEYMKEELGFGRYRSSF